MDRTVFFNSIRDSIFKGILTQSQVDGCNAILDIFSGYDNRQIAYCLATAYHETGHTMKPIEEYGKGAGHKYGQKIDMNGKPYTTPDKIYYGRGPVQITWRSNYSYFTQQAKNHGHSWDFLNNPELMLQNEPAYWVMKFGMTNGSFTGKKLNDYFNTNITDPVNARKIINGLDCAELIASYYFAFLKAIEG